ncbi:MAG TPA: septum site-determining protein MinC [Pseudomonas sabulinigri]|jgi:septum site-determining protein MinC|uniref:Septum formation inhibitor MinC C-terminal domain-containing protein n=1 Tax=marine sediment metagenome TaxID=412755 RepID=A0A0F9V6Y2_9ZZZZ|nr:septum site-determining protein MinC [Halopseudomonas sabulinigri]HEC50716.1 septum site-determining protein MinC [Halopseudomonas sabulinigri]|tara:strand:- start:177 stop:926 length:750 start_codon:yes stop_codon:yes gene_type:complete
MTADTTLDLLDNDPVFNLKGGMLTMTVVELARLSQDHFARQLAEKVEQAPNFFVDTPVVIALDKLTDRIDAAALKGLLEICRQHGLQPVALRGGESFRPLAQSAGMVLVPVGRQREKSIETPALRPEPAPVAQAPRAAPSGGGKLITEPVRSGQQVYARGGDLIVMAPVSAGAELLADGHIHVYGPLRGRALAGVQGNTEARIFCQNLEAELVSIAGHYKVAEDLRKEKQWKQAVHISLDGDSLKMTAL